MPEINPNLTISPEEFRFTTSRSGGPGGQNVNKVETRVTLWFDVEASNSLTGEQKQIIRQKLATRINKEGLLWVTSSRHRTQFANREAALEKFSELLQTALLPQPTRKHTRISFAIRAKRLENKRHRSVKKKLRSSPVGWE
jgi:ribosome-associated protein